MYEDTDGDGFRDSLEASTGSDLNDPNSTPLQQGLVAGTPLMAMPPICRAMETMENGATLGADRHGQANMAYSFDGNDWINCGNDSSLHLTNAVTISAWAFSNNNNKNNWSAPRWIVGKNRDIYSGYHLTFADYNQVAGFVRVRPNTEIEKSKLY